jgi:hypothetical protein
MTRRHLPALLALAGVLLSACGEKAAELAVPADAHIYAHQPSGVGLELPAVWAGRYRVADSITVAAEGLERELSLRLVRGDSSLVGEPLLVIRVFSNAGWNAVPADTAGARWGTIVAKDAARTVAVRPAPGNPLTADQPDAAAFDSLMIALLGRQMKASLRAPGR